MLRRRSKCITVLIAKERDLLCRVRLCIDYFRFVSNERTDGSAVAENEYFFFFLRIQKINNCEMLYFNQSYVQ